MQYLYYNKNWTNYFVVNCPEIDNLFLLLQRSSFFNRKINGMIKVNLKCNI